MEGIVISVTKSLSLAAILPTRYKMKQDGSKRIHPGYEKLGG